MIRCSSCGGMYCFDAAGCPQCGFSPRIVAGFKSWAPELATEGKGFKSEYFSDLAKLEEDNFWFRARNSLITWAVQKFFPNFESFLEVGCGTGFVLAGIAKAFQSRRLVGTELFSAGLEFAARRISDCEFIQMDARHIPYEAEFDVVGAFDVLEHIEEDDLVISGMYRTVKPGGGLLVTVPQHNWLWSVTDEYSCHVRRYSAARLHRKLNIAGFHIVRSTSFMSILLPAMWISRRRRRKVFDPLDEFRIPGWVNRSFESLLQVERKLITAGASLPFGGSLLVIGKKSESLK